MGYVDYMLSMGQRDLWDEQQRVPKLQEQKPVFTRLAESVPWESFRILIGKVYSQERETSAAQTDRSTSSLQDGGAAAAI